MRAHARRPAIRTTCPYCGVGCGIAAQGARRALDVTGDETHPANAGQLCSKGSALAETLTLDGRLLYPMIGDRRTTWSRATRVIAHRLREIIAELGPDAVAFYVSGQLLTEDYYVANKLMKGFIGSGNIDTNSRLCMASAVAAHKLAFGKDVVPGCYEDLELADLIVFAGHNAAWTHPVLHRRIEAQSARGQRCIAIDPRETDTARGAWLHLKLRSQTDIRLWNGLLAFLWEAGAVDRGFIETRTTGLEQTLAALAREDQSISAVAHDCGLDSEDVRAFYRAFAQTERTVTLFSQGVNQSEQGVAKGLAVVNAHLATGRVSRPGASPFSITGQPNAMGGRETGGMANTLAAHMDFAADDIERVGRFWRAARMAERPGLKAVDMFDAVAHGRIKAIWIMATNPAVSLPEAERVREALRACPLVIVSDVMAETDTAGFAHVRLPALAWGEKDGTVTNSERCISRQRAFFKAPGAARADWRIIADVAREMGFGDAFAYRSAADVFREYAALTAFENDGARLLDIGALAKLSDQDYANLAPTRWPIGVDRPFADRPFSTQDRKAKFHPVEATVRTLPAEFPLALNTGRIRDQWHTMTRTGLAPRLMRHSPEPYVDVHPRDAAKAGVAEGMLAEVRTAFGRAILLVRLSASVRESEIFAPMHWSDAFAPQARVNPLVNPRIDPTSGQPEFKHTPARLAPATIAWRGFLVTRARKDPAGVWWRRMPLDVGCLYEIAAPASAPAATRLAAALFDDIEDEGLLTAEDRGGQFLRWAAVRGERLERAFFATSGRGLPRREWLIEKLAAERIDDADRRLLLVGGAAGGAKRGQCVCACFNVTREEIEAFAASDAAVTVQHVGARLKAGTNCGSCRLEIAQILARRNARAA